MKKVSIIPPPVELPEVSEDQVAEFGKVNNPINAHPVIGMLARFATEKGVEVLLKALPEILKQFPRTLVQFVGPYQNIIGEEQYFHALEPEIKRYQESGNWVFLGSKSPVEVAAFFKNLDLLVVPSINSTESFGLVQIEAMKNGVPCVTSNLPGVRQPVLVHKMGRIFPIGDSSKLANSILEILNNLDQREENSADFSRYSPDKVAEAYENLFAEIHKEIHGPLH